ncbi:MAG: threonine synthase [Candidatus Heimdallarchaeota archaeon]|nr:threonine synthase [Candidatus Heimdallarchaeota archaeon]MCK4770037.1 threonine synthase [Candidatus Heimdallarchaeota archaeon]
MRKHILRCITCNKEFDPKPGLYYCEDCGKILGTLEVIYDYESIKKETDVKEKKLDKKASMYQFDFLLPTKSKTKFDEYIGGTPLYKFDLLGLKDVLVKYDGSNPSSSYKDRASSIAINIALDEGNDTMFCASTGNAASSLAMLNAHTEMKTYIFVPSSIPDEKRAQLEISGAEVFAVEGTYDEVYDLSLEFGLKKGWYCRHAAINPYLLEGKKTGAFEIVIQNDFEVPDYVLVGVGDGTVISSLYKGFWEFKEIGLIDKIPKIIGVQAVGIAGVKTVFDKGKPYKPQAIEGKTIADSISVGNPRDVIKACTYIEACNGYFISLTDDEIVDAITELGKITGIFAEPAGAVPYGGLKKLIYEKKITESDTVCLVITGSGLKDVNAVKDTINKTSVTFDEVVKRFEE